MATGKKLELSFLEKIQESQAQVSIFLVNGVKLHGVIEAFEEEVIFLKGATTQIVYKHAISTVVPA